MKLLLTAVVSALLVGCSSQQAPAPAAQQAPAPGATITATSKSPEAIEHFKKGEVLFDNLRTTESAAEFAQAIKLDPDFTLARAFHGQVTPGQDGLTESDRAAAAAANLPEPERVLIEAIAANRRGDIAASRASLKRLIEIAPSDWRAHYSLGQQLLLDQKYDEAVTALKKATSLNPDAGGAQNMLGYAALRQGDAAGAVAAFQEYVRILPREPNPQDSLGEALLAAGRFKESEAAFQKALELSPEFWTAHQGVAYTKLYAGDWAGGRAALEKAKATATRPTDKISVDDELSAVAVAQRDTKTAFKIMDAIEKTEGLQPSDVAFVPLRRALVLNDAGRYREALAPIAATLATIESGSLPAGVARGLKRQALIERIAAESGLHDAAAALRTSTALDEGAAADPDNPVAQSAMHYGRGMLAIAKNDTAEARKHFNACSQEDIVCKWQGVVTAEKAGDKAGAAAARTALLKNYLRDPGALVMRSRVAAPAN
jgi:tetratricopeptide (TPR) repeat protein